MGPIISTWIFYQHVDLHLAAVSGFMGTGMHSETRISNEYYAIKGLKNLLGTFLLRLDIETY